MKKPTFKKTRLFQTKMFPWNVAIAVSRLGFLAKNLEMIGHFFGWVRKKIARSAILKCGVSHENLKT